MNQDNKPEQRSAEEILNSFMREHRNEVFPVNTYLYLNEGKKSSCYVRRDIAVKSVASLTSTIEQLRKELGLKDKDIEELRETAKIRSGFYSPETIEHLRKEKDTLDKYNSILIEEKSKQQAEIERLKGEVEKLNRRGKDWQMYSDGLDMELGESHQSILQMTEAWNDQKSVIKDLVMILHKCLKDQRAQNHGGGSSLQHDIESALEKAKRFTDDKDNEVTAED